MAVAVELRTMMALLRRAVNELARVPAAAIPGVLSPTIFTLGLTAIFGNLTDLSGFGTDKYMNWIIGVGFLQAAAFTGAAMGVNLARDIELGWFDRLLASPASRATLLAGTVLMASLRISLPIALLLIAGLGAGLMDWPGLDGLAIAFVLAAMMSTTIACWSVIIALRTKTQAAGPLMQAGAIIAILCTTSYAPQELLTGWLHDVARYNPVTAIIEGVRQGFVGAVTWHDTWPALLAATGLMALFALFALRGMRAATD